MGARHASERDLTVPFSLRDNDQAVRDYARYFDAVTALDVGPGSGTYGLLLRDLIPKIDAIEIWPSYVLEFNLLDIYSEVIVGDIREFARANFQFHSIHYDLIIFGDVLEHMSVEDGAMVWEWAKTVAKHGIISVPTIEWEQDAVNGNPYEAHVQDCISPDDFRRVFGPFDQEWVYEQTATFIKAFE